MAAVAGTSVELLKLLLARLMVERRSDKGVASMEAK